MRKLCANISMLFNELPFLQRYEAAAANGFEAVECLFPYGFTKQEVTAAIQKSGMRQVLINTSAGDWDAGDRGLACDVRLQIPFQHSVTQALSYAMVMGKPLVHVMAGLVPVGVSLEQAEKVYVMNMRWAAAQALKLGISLTMEAINPVDMPNYMLCSQAQALRLFKAINAENLGIQFDFFHCQKHEGNALEQFNQLLPYILHVQIAGVPERNEPNTGVLDYAPVFKAIDEAMDAGAYAGFVGCEYRPKTTTVAGLSWMTAT